MSPRIVVLVAAVALPAVTAAIPAAAEPVGDAVASAKKPRKKSCLPDGGLADPRLALDQKRGRAGRQPGDEAVQFGELPLPADDHARSVSGR